MKTKQLLLSLSLLFVVTINYAQASFTNAGIAVQGIARDANNIAIQNATVALKFSFFYKISGNENPVLSPFTKNVVTDNFGVFSTIIDPLADNNQLFSNYKVWLRIENGNTLLSEAVLNHVPYAISANNGVPTGSIMPYMGNEAPTGWVMCNGQSLTAINGAEALITMVGNNAPNLKGRFLKGVGTGVETNVDPIALNTPQGQSTRTKQHSHQSGDIRTNGGGVHTHTSKESAYSVAAGGSYGIYIGYNYQNANLQDMNIPSGGTHNHDIIGNTANSVVDNSEVRPSSYGVNYIIKL